MMNAITMNNAAQNTVVTAKDIAKATGYSLGTVYVALSGKNGNCKPSTMDKIREMAKIMGYDPKLAKKMNGLNKKGKTWSWSTSTSGNFATRSEETNRMLRLRAEGYTNVEIGKKIGVHVHTVLKRIGRQPALFTKTSHILSGERQRRRNTLRKQSIFQLKIAEYEKLQKDVEKQNGKIIELEMNAQRIADEAKFMRGQMENRIVELDAYRKEAEKAANALGVSL